MLIGHHHSFAVKARATLAALLLLSTGLPQTLMKPATRAGQFPHNFTAKLGRQRAGAAARSCLQRQAAHHRTHRESSHPARAQPPRLRPAAGRCRARQADGPRKVDRAATSSRKNRRRFQLQARLQSSRRGMSAQTLLASIRSPMPPPRRWASPSRNIASAWTTQRILRKGCIRRPANCRRKCSTSCSRPRLCAPSTASGSSKSS